MSSNNNDNSGAAMAIGVVVAAAYVMAIAFAVVIVVLAIVLTIIAFMAWNRPLRVGKMVITPAEARQFVWRGWIGFWALPFALALGNIFLGWPINWDYLFYYMLAGYCAGSIGIEMLFGDEERQGPLVEYLPPQPQIPPPPKQPELPAPRREPFRFASWDDEEN
ncbi:hypothetical protein [Sinorhizobium medicae]